MTTVEQRVPRGDEAVPDAGRSHRIRVVATAVLAVLATGLAIWALSERDRSRESSLPILPFLRFGDPAESPYCLPYSEGDSFYGTSGTSPSNPHLHFEVFEGQGEGSQWYKTLPVNFRNAKGALDDRGGLAESDYEALACPS